MFPGGYIHEVLMGATHFIMKPQFYLLVIGTDAGYRHAHDTIELATTEAKRLHTLTGNEVIILELVGTVKTVEVPVVQKRVEVKITERLVDNLPF